MVWSGSTLKGGCQDLASVGALETREDNVREPKRQLL